MKFPRLAHHEDFAVDTGVHDFAETVGGAFPQEAHERFTDVHGFHLKAVHLLPVGDQLRLAEKGGDKMQATDNQPLFHDQAGSEDAVQPAGKQGKCMRSGGIHKAILLRRIHEHKRLLCWRTREKGMASAFAGSHMPIFMGASSDAPNEVWENRGTHTGSLDPLRQRKS